MLNTIGGYAACLLILGNLAALVAMALIGLVHTVVDVYRNK